MEIIMFKHSSTIHKVSAVFNEVLTALSTRDRLHFSESTISGVNKGNKKFD